MSALVLIMLGVLLAAPVGTEEAASLFAEGETLLKEGNLDGALTAYLAAARMAPENKEYLNQAMMLRRVKQLKIYVDTTEPNDKWDNIVRSLHTFYLTHNMAEEALTMNRMAFQKRNNAFTAALLSENLLELNRNEEALKLLSGLDDKMLDGPNRIYLGIALARLNRVDEAREIRDACKITGQAGLSILYDAARLNTLIGDRAQAMDQLKLFFEKTPPSQLDRNRAFVKACKDFAALKGVQGFDAVMNTASKVEESGCSSGSSCASCPSRTKCSSNAEDESCDGCTDKK